MRPGSARARLVAPALFALSACTWGAPDPQEVFSRSLRPTMLGPIAEPGQVPRRTLKARVWVDQGHRRAMLRWEHRLRRQVDGANRVLIAALGAQVEIVSVEPWGHDGGKTNLESDLRALLELDDGRGVDLVIGLVSPLAVFVPSFGHLGLAQTPGKYMVMRGIERAEEHRWLADVLDERPAEEREALYQSRLRHDEVALFLHEIGHTLGAIHVWDDDALMATAGSHRQYGFSPENLALMGLSLEHRTQDEPFPPAARLAVARYLTESKWDGWRSDAKASMLAYLGVRDGGRGASRPAATGAAGPETRAPVADGPLRAAYDALQAGDAEAAWTTLAPQLETNGEDPRARTLACEVAIQRDRTSKAALQWCARLAEAEPARARYHVLHALALQGNGQPEPALEAVRRAEAAIETRPVDQHPALWSMVAGAYQNLDALTWAVSAAAHAEQEVGAKLAAHVKTLRDQLGAVDGVLQGVAPEQEPRFVGAMRELSGALNRAEEARALELRAMLAADFPKAGRPQLQVCTWLGHRHRWKKVRAVCKAAVATNPRAHEPHLVLAVAAFAQRRPARAVRPLERVLALSPNTRDAWSMLLSAYRATGQSDKAVKLAQRYKARFGAAP